MADTCSSLLCSSRDTINKLIVFIMCNCFSFSFFVFLYYFYEVPFNCILIWRTTTFMNNCFKFKNEIKRSKNYFWKEKSYKQDYQGCRFSFLYFWRIRRGSWGTWGLVGEFSWPTFKLGLRREIQKCHYCCKFHSCHGQREWLYIAKTRVKSPSNEFADIYAKAMTLFFCPKVPIHVDAI